MPRHLLKSRLTRLQRRCQEALFLLSRLLHHFRAAISTPRLLQPQAARYFGWAAYGFVINSHDAGWPSLRRKPKCKINIILPALSHAFIGNGISATFKHLSRERAFCRESLRHVFGAQGTFSRVMLPY